MGSQTVLIYDAFPYLSPDVDEGSTIHTIFEEAGFQVNHPRENECTIDFLNQMTQYGFIMLITHGSGDSFATGEKVTWESLLLHSVDWIRGRLKLSNLLIKTVNGIEYRDDFFEVTNKFIQNLDGSFANSIVYNGACDGFVDNTLLKDGFLNNKGAATYFGFNNSTSGDFSVTISSELVEKLLNGENVGDAYESIKNSPSHYPNGVCAYYYDFDYNLGQWVCQYTSCLEMDGATDVTWYETPPTSAPVVTTNEVSAENIATTTATISGSVVFPEPSQPIEYERGFLYDTSPYVLILDVGTNQVVYPGTDLLNFSCTLTDLFPNTTYYVRAYSRWENNEVIYGNTVSFTTIEEFLPTVQIFPVTNITSTSAVLSASVDGQTDYAVTERGFYYSLLPDQGLGDNSVQVPMGQGVGQFNYEIMNLVPGNTYYVNAYAILETGIIIYGIEQNFTTINDDPQVITLQADNVTDVSVMLNGNVTGETSQIVVERGFCYGTSSNQGIGNYGSNKIVVGSGMGVYNYFIENLSPRTTYYVKAYAITNYDHIVYGNQISFTTLGVQGPEGTVGGLFSVSDNRQVWFSKGSLQYQASTNTWRFAENQYDFVGGMDWYWNVSYGNVPGSSNDDVSPTYSGWIDQFCWGTSGYNHGAVCYQPWAVNGNIDDYYAYGLPQASLGDQTGKADWGYNAISNGGNAEGMWRTLTSSEWYYLLRSRSTPSGMRFAGATVNDVIGLLILPDEWSESVYPLNRVNHDYINFSDNVISLNDWETRLVPAGVVFLPCNNICNSGFGIKTSLYWTANPRLDEFNYNCYCIMFQQSGDLQTYYWISRSDRAFVRLVQDY